MKIFLFKLKLKKIYSPISPEGVLGEGPPEGFFCGGISLWGGAKYFLLQNSWSPTWVVMTVDYIIFWRSYNK